MIGRPVIDAARLATTGSTRPSIGTHANTAVPTDQKTKTTSYVQAVGSSVVGRSDRIVLGFISNQARVNVIPPVNPSTGVRPVPIAGELGNWLRPCAILKRNVWGKLIIIGIGKHSRFEHRLMAVSFPRF